MGSAGELRRIGMFVDADPERCKRIIDTVRIEAIFGWNRPIA